MRKGFEPDPPTETPGCRPPPPLKPLEKKSWNCAGCHGDGYIHSKICQGCTDISEETIPVDAIKAARDSLVKQVGKSESVRKIDEFLKAVKSTD